MAVGSARSEDGEWFARALWPVLAVLLYATFMQVDIRSLPLALRDHRFLRATLLANFVLAPVLVWALLLLVPLPAGVQVGLVLVLLAPCTDWFTSFTHLGRGDTRLAIAATPLMLAVQFPLLPLYLWLIADADLDGMPLRPVLVAFLVVVVLPLAVAALTQEARRTREVPAVAGRAVVPLLALTLFLVAASQAPAVREAGGELARVVLVAALYLLGAVVIARAITRWAGLGVLAARTLAFNLGTRNSFVVLPIALALPEAYALAAPAIAVQVLVEVAGMVAFVHWVPSHLFPSQPEPAEVPH